MKVLVTGSSGFLGSIFVELLKKRNISYVAYDRNNPEKLALDFDSVVNFGGVTPNSDIKNGAPDSGAYYSANVGGAELLLKNIEKNKNLKRFVNIGTAAEYGFGATPIAEDAVEKPGGPYGESKLAQSRLVEKFSEEKGVKVINLRLFNIAGIPERGKAGQVVISNPFIFENLIQQFGVNFNGKITVNNKNDIRDYVDIDDVMEAIFLALETKNARQYEVINICSGVGATLEDVVELFGKTLKKKYEISSTRMKEVTQSVGVNSKAKKILNWAPKISLEESVKKMIW